MEEQVKPTTPSPEPAPEQPPAPEAKDPSAKPSHKNLIILISTIVVMLILATFAVLFFTKSWIFAEDKDKPTSSQTDNEPIFSKEDYPRVDASTVTQPLAVALYRDFTGDTEAKTTDFDFTKTHEAYVKLIEKKTDLIIVTQPSTDELQIAATAGEELVVTPVVDEGFVFFVCTENPVDSLTIEQVQDIYMGKITNWKDVGGDDLKIAAYQRQPNSGSQTGMEEIVMKDKTLMTPEREDLVIDGMMGLVASVVKGYDNQPNAIGYSYYYYVVTMYQDIDQDIADGVKLLGINGVKPEPSTIQDDSYPFTTSYYIVTRKSDDGNENIQKLKSAMLSTRGQQIAEDNLYVPTKH